MRVGVKLIILSSSTCSFLFTLQMNYLLLNLRGYCYSWLWLGLLWKRVIQQKTTFNFSKVQDSIILDGERFLLLDETVVLVDRNTIFAIEVGDGYRCGAYI